MSVTAADPYGDDIYTEPDGDPDTLSNLGPPEPDGRHLGGHRGADQHPVADGVEGNAFVEHYELQPIDRQTNGPQLFYGLRYHTHIVKPGEVETFHDQVGYWLWEPATNAVILTLGIPRGQVLLAGGHGRAGRHRVRGPGRGRLRGLRDPLQPVPRPGLPHPQLPDARHRQSPTAPGRTRRRACSTSPAGTSRSPTSTATPSPGSHRRPPTRWPQAAAAGLGRQPRDRRPTTRKQDTRHEPPDARAGPGHRCGWSQIDAEAARSLKHFLAARRLVDFAGPLGWEHSAVDTGPDRALDSAPSHRSRGGRRAGAPTGRAAGPVHPGPVGAGRRRPGCDRPRPRRRHRRRPGRRPGRGPTWCSTGRAGRRHRRNRRRLAPRPVPIGDDYSHYPEHVAKAVAALRAADIAGPYAIALGSRCYTGVTETTEHGGYPVFEHLRQILGGPVVWAPAVDGAVVLSQRGGDFELTVGEDFSIGYRSSDADWWSSTSKRASPSGSTRRRRRCIWLTADRSHPPEGYQAARSGRPVLVGRTPRRCSTLVSTTRSLDLQPLVDLSRLTSSHARNAVVAQAFPGLGDLRGATDTDPQTRPGRSEPGTTATAKLGPEEHFIDDDARSASGHGRPVPGTRPPRPGETVHRR